MCFRRAPGEMDVWYCKTGKTKMCFESYTRLLYYNWLLLTLS